MRVSLVALALLLAACDSQPAPPASPSGRWQGFVTRTADTEIRTSLPNGSVVEFACTGSEILTVALNLEESEGIVTGTVEYAADRTILASRTVIKGQDQSATQALTGVTTGGSSVSGSYQAPILSVDPDEGLVFEFDLILEGDRASGTIGMAPLDVRVEDRDIACLRAGPFQMEMERVR